MYRRASDPRAGYGGPALSVRGRLPAQRPTVVLRWALRVAVVLSLGGPVAGEPREPVELIPAGSLLCWAGRPLPEATPADSRPSTLQTLLELGTRLASQPLDQGTQLNVRAAEMFGLMIRYPHALALIDAQAQPTQTDATARKVDRLRFALVVQNRGDTEPFLRIIQKAVNEQTNSGEATLESKTAGRWTYQELRDRRLPEWVAIAWGHLDGHFVLTVGPGVWPQIAAVAAGEEESLVHDAWYAAARGSRARKGLIEVLVSADGIQQRLDPFVEGRASAFFQAWDAGGLQQAHWLLGYEGRALYCIAHFRINNRTVRRVYADADASDRRLLAAVPSGCRYAVFALRAEELLPRFFRGLLAVQGPKVRANVERVWAEVQARHGFDAQRDLLAHLGDHIILHNDPPHPLRLPLALTTLTEIRENPAAVRQTVEAMGRAWQAALAEASAPPFHVLGEDDGIWYLRFGAGPEWLGLAGPAWTVTDRFLITSWSPMALREYLERVPEEVKRRSAPAERVPATQAHAGE